MRGFSLSAPSAGISARPITSDLVNAGGRAFAGGYTGGLRTAEGNDLGE